VRVLVAISWLALASVAGADRWEDTRRTVIEPINSELHRHLPQFLKARDMPGVLELYATDEGGGLGWDGMRPLHPGRLERSFVWEGRSVRESIRDRYARLLHALPSIERAELRIDRVAWRTPEPGGFPAVARLIVRGTCRDGQRCQLEQELAWRVAEHEGKWKITAEDVRRRTLVTRAAPGFETVTDAAGVANVHTNDTSPPFSLFGGADSPIRTPSGSAVGDFDRDGCEDIFLAGSPDAVL